MTTTTTTTTTTIAELDPTLESTHAAALALLAAGLDIASDEVRDLAQRAAMVDERSAYTEKGRPRSAYVGGSVRCAALLALLVERGLPRPGELLRWAAQSQEVIEVLLATKPSQDEIDGGLRATCLDHSFDPNLDVVRRLLAAKPSRAALDGALLDATAGAARYVGVAVDFAFFDMFELLLDAGGRPDWGAGERLTALHYLVSFAPHDVAGDKHRMKRAARGDELLRKAIAAATSPDVVDSHGRTPLHVACVDRSPERVKILIAAGADRQRPDAAGKTPTKLAGRDEALCQALGVAAPPSTAKKSRVIGPPRPVPTPVAADPFAIGTRVMHVKFGAGEVVSSTGSGATRKLGVMFGDGQTLTLAASFLTPE